MALMPRYSYHRNPISGELEVTPLPMWVWLIIFAVIGGLMLFSTVSQTDDIQIDDLNIDQTEVSQYG